MGGEQGMLAIPALESARLMDMARYPGVSFCHVGRGRLAGSGVKGSRRWFFCPVCIPTATY